MTNDARRDGWLHHLRAASRSVRFAVTFWHALVLAGILAALSITLYVTTAAGLNRTINQRLALTASGTADTLFAFWRAERATNMSPGNWETAPRNTFRDLVSSGDFAAFVLRWAEKTRALDSEESIRVLARGGQALAMTSAFAAMDLPVSPTAQAALRDGHAGFETLTLPDGRRIRLVTHPVRERGAMLYALQVADSLEDLDASLARVRKRLYWLLPCALLLTSVVVWGTASWSLRPVGRMIRQVEGLGARGFQERIDVPETGDEIQQLAATFNAMLERVETAFQRVRQFSAAASHELRTPLTAMKGELEVTLRRPRPANEYEEVLRTQLGALDDMILTVQELLALARNDASSRSIDKQLVDCRALVLDAGQKWQKLTDGKQIRVSVEAAQPLWVLGERHLLERLVANLLDNAVRHTPPGGQVTLSAARQNGHAQLVVRDTGPGIAPEEIPHIFDRFFKPRAMQPDGSTGLGLGLCRWIAEAHQGHIDVASTPKQGASFTVSLPLSERPAAAA